MKNQVNIEKSENGKKITKFLDELEDKTKAYYNKKIQIRVKVEILQNTKSKKFFMWAKEQIMKEVWNVKVDLKGQGDSDLSESSVRELLRGFQRDVSKESLKSFEHLSEGVGDDFKISLQFINTSI